MRKAGTLLKNTSGICRAQGNARKVVICVLAACFALGSAALMTVAADMYIYPANGQNQDQQNKDQGECHQWAVQQSGVDPEKVAEQLAQPQASQRRGGAVKGAGGGAALGAVGGAIGGDTAKGAEVGAAVGGTMGAMRARQSIRHQQQATNQAHAQANQQLQQYDSAYSTCIRGRGYTVSQ